MGLLYTVLYCVLTVITSAWMKIIDAVFKFFYGCGKTVLPADDPLLLIPAHKLSDMIRSRELRAEDVMQAYICRAKTVNPFINAIVGDQYDKALQRAQNLDNTLDSLSPKERDEQFSAKLKPFLGVPLSVKEAFEWTGMGQTSGVCSRKHLRSTVDAPVLRNLQEAGAIPFIQTNTSEACMWFESSNYAHGCTNNAYDTTRIVGGSSGGEGCVISAAASVIGIGSDIGGSIRMPCFFNGIFGHKPTNGLVDNKGQFPIPNSKAMPLLTTGPMCRYASDLIPELKVMAGPESIAKLQLDTKVDLSKLKVISVPDDGGSLMVSKVDQQLKDAQRKVCDFLASEGATVEVRNIKKFRVALDMWVGRMNLADDSPKFSKIIAGEDPKPVNCFYELCKWIFGASDHTLPALLLGIFDDFGPSLTKSMDMKAVKTLDKLREELLKELGTPNHDGKKKNGAEENGVDTSDKSSAAGRNENQDGKEYAGTILLYPTHPKISPYHNHPILTPFNFAYTGLFNALGFPVTQCPLGLSREGLPLGVQVVTAPYCDHLTLAVAEALERKFGGWANPSKC